MADLQQYKCPCCGGAIEFDSTLQKMKCPYCDTEYEVETLASYDDALKGDRDDVLQWETGEENEWGDGEIDDLRVYVCQSCGGEIVGDETVGATTCPYCDNPVVMMGQFAGDLKPDFVIPFKLDKHAAIAALKKHYGGKKLLPKVFADENHIEEVKGVYVPFWLFDAEAEANVRYKTSRTRFWSDSRYHYTETSFFSVTRQGSLGFDRVPVDGSTKMDDTLMESIEPYDFSEAVDFRTAYLSGYLAQRYDVTAEDSIARANERIKQSTEDAFRNTVQGYNTVITEHSGVNLRNSTCRYALFPVWLLNTQWNGKKYTFAMNGQTGKLVGDLPADKKAVWRYLWRTTAIGTAVVFLLQLLLHLL
jgi:DNA-directed RNA polymerase subunit RPC12/RpoP